MLDRDVAVKVMSKGLADADSRARFLREARAAARLQHPNIVVIYELGEHEGAPFMVLELLEGVDLQRAIDGGIRPDPRATLPVVLQLLAGLGHAHEHGIVHRDVKPSNVFLPSGRPAKIMDFGVARLTGLGTTTTGVVVGTPNYMSPEQASAGELDGRSDLFSAGLILYELVTGEKAYKADSLVAILYKILNEAPDLSLIPRGAAVGAAAGGADAGPRPQGRRSLPRRAVDVGGAGAGARRTWAGPWTGRRPRTRRCSCGRGRRMRARTDRAGARRPAPPPRPPAGPARRRPAPPAAPAATPADPRVLAGLGARPPRGGRRHGPVAAGCGPRRRAGAAVPPPRRRPRPTPAATAEAPAPTPRAGADRVPHCGAHRRPRPRPHAAAAVARGAPPPRRRRRPPPPRRRPRPRRDSSPRRACCGPRTS